MNDLQFADDVLARIRARDGRYHERAYLFVLAAIEYLQGRLEFRRHVSGVELAWACRDFALRQFGLFAPQVFGYWGVRSTGDIGRMVFTLVEVGLLSTQPTDRVEDFENVYDLDAEFAAYEWQGLPGS